MKKKGLIWFIVPVVMIIINDIMAYYFGFFYGKTPLIELSPKKTWEGFIGGGLTTVMFGIFLSYILCQFPYFTCPIDYSAEADKVVILDCAPSYLFIPQEYTFNFVRKFSHSLNTILNFIFFFFCCLGRFRDDF